MNERKRKCIEYSLIAVFFFVMGIPMLFHIFGSGDELWNYNFAINIAEGRTPYKDFNIVQTPLSPYVSALFLKIFGNSLISFRLAGIVLATAAFFLLYIVCSKISKSRMISFVASSFVYALIYHIWMFNYNYLNLLLTLLIVCLEVCNDEEQQHSCFRRSTIALLYGLLPLIKQSTGGIMLLSFLVWRFICILRNAECRKRNIHQIGLALIPGFVFVVILVFTGIFPDFYDYAIAGIGTFKHRTHLWDYIRTTPIAIAVVLFIIGTIIFSLIRIKRGTGAINPSLHKKILVISIAAGTVAYPLCDHFHMMVAVVPYVICFLCCLKIRQYDRKQNIACVLIAVVIVVFSSASVIKTSAQNTPSQLNHYTGIPMSQNLETKIREIDEYILSQESKGTKVIIADECAVACMIPIDRYTKDFDMLLVGNLGTQSIEDLLSVNENAIYLIAHDEDMLGYQAHFDLIHYIKENYVKIGEVSNLDAYQKIN